MTLDKERVIEDLRLRVELLTEETERMRRTTSVHTVQVMRRVARGNCISNVKQNIA